MTVTIHQPYYLPYLGYFHKILNSDIFVILDDAQFEKGNFYNRNKINSNNGPILLTIPVSVKNHDDPINSVTIPSHKWQIKHFKTITQSYKKAPFFSDHEQFLEDVYINNSWNSFSELTFFMMQYFLEYLEVEIPIFKSSKMQIASVKTQRLLDISLKVKADTYLSGPSGRKYLDTKLFEAANVKIIYQEFIHPEYNQIHPDFISHLTILDLLMNEGKKSKEIILSNQIDKV